MAFSSVLQRMHDRLFAKIGDEAVLRGTVPCLINIERGVVVDYETGDDKFYRSEYAQTVSVANIPAKHTPKPGDSLTVGAESYTIDAIIADNGYMMRCVLR